MNVGNHLMRAVGDPSFYIGCPGHLKIYMLNIKMGINGRFKIRQFLKKLFLSDCTNSSSEQWRNPSRKASYTVISSYTEKPVITLYIW